MGAKQRYFCLGFSSINIFFPFIFTQVTPVFAVEIVMGIESRIPILNPTIGKLVWIRIARPPVTIPSSPKCETFRGHCIYSKSSALCLLNACSYVVRDFHKVSNTFIDLSTAHQLPGGWTAGEISGFVFILLLFVTIACCLIVWWRKRENKGFFSG